MPGVFIGSTEITIVGTIKIGTTDVQEIYVGATKIFPPGGGDPSITYFYDPLNDGTLPGGSTFIRASVAEQYDGTDFAEVGIGVIREDSVQAVGGAKGYLAEPLATNEIEDSNELDAASWTATFVTPTDDGVGTLGLNEYSVDAGVVSATHRLLATVNTIAGEGSFTAIVKQGSGGRYTNISGKDAPSDYATYDAQAGTITEEGTITDARIVDLGNGYYKCVTQDAVDLGQAFPVFSISNSATPGTREPSFPAANETIIYAYTGFENTAFSTTPIISSAGSETRQADVLDSGVVITAAFSALLDLTLPEIVGTGLTISLLGPDATSTDILRVDASFNIIMDDGGTPTTIGTSVAGARLKVAYGRDGAGRSGSLDGATAVTGDAPSSAHEGDTFQIGCTNSLNQSRCVHHTQTLYNVRKSDAELETLST